MIPFEIHPAALQEFHDAVEYYWSADPKIAADFGRTYLKKRESARDNPLLYRTREGEVRRANFGTQFKEWYIAFILWNEKVVVLAVAHAKRRPYYFRARIAEAQKLFP